jgi:23S rRNA (cytosine1962-C5)-methyltransferase
MKAMQPPNDHELISRLEAALQARSMLLQQHNQGVVRLFNGFYEGCPDLVADLYAGTLVLYGYGQEEQTALDLLNTAQAFYLSTLPGVDCVLQKFRYAQDASKRKGVLSYGDRLANSIVEQQVRYALDLRLNQDASFYADTRHLRSWLIQNSSGKNVLNLFAYTGSLGIAALAGGARQATQVDLKQKFLEIARQSARLNGFEASRHRLETADFFSKVAYYKRQGTLFDLAILDAPFFSTTGKGSVDLVNQSVRLVNKLRPLVVDGGRLVVVNNALFLSGKEFYERMSDLCQDGYLNIEEIIPIPEDITGYPETILRKPPADPQPFNHPTKILILRIKRK